MNGYNMKLNAMKYNSVKSVSIGSQFKSYLKKTGLWESFVIQQLRDLKKQIKEAKLKRQITIVPLDHMLCGGENGLSAAQYFRHTGNFHRPSTPISKSPHVQFLEQYMQIGDEIFRPEIFNKTAYYANAKECKKVVGHYFGYTKDDQIKMIAQNFISEFSGNTSKYKTDNNNPYFSSPDKPIHIRPICFSHYYEVIDGNHRLAIAIVRGEKVFPAFIRPETAVTPLQQLLLDQVWLQGKREIYQPIESPEINDEWILVRCCDDRLGMIKRFLEENKLMPPQCKTYFDIACNYGWFVSEFEKLGFEASGVEIDWAAVEIGRMMYGLKDQINRSEVVSALENDEKSYDIVTCFSLLHHFALDRASISAEDMLKIIDSKTKTAFFMDTGQGHEKWFSDSLPEWDADYIENWLRSNSSFKKIYRLGKDSDNVPPFEDNYSRTLFACMR